jgi:hypothetical protein
MPDIKRFEYDGKLRKLMGWKWEDINTITGLTVARTNMTKG